MTYRKLFSQSEMDNPRKNSFKRASNSKFHIQAFIPFIFRSLNTPTLVVQLTA